MLITSMIHDRSKTGHISTQVSTEVAKDYWPMKVSNEEARRRARTCTISEMVRFEPVYLLNSDFSFIIALFALLCLTLTLFGQIAIKSRLIGS